MESSIWLWAGFNLFVLALLAFDLAILHGKEREIRVGEAVWLSLFYIVLISALSECRHRWFRAPATTDSDAPGLGVSAFFCPRCVYPKVARNSSCGTV